MDDLQFVYPWSHPFYAGIVILILAAALLLGLYLLYRSSKLENRKWKIFLTLFSFFLIAFPTINFIGYKYNEHLTFTKYAGKYHSKDNRSELNLLTNNTWTSCGLPFNCKSGKWYLKITEDGSWIELSCLNSEYTFEQLWPTNDLTIFIIENGNMKDRIELKKYESSPN